MVNRRRKRILMLHTANSPVVRNDEECLSAAFDVRIFPIRLAPRGEFLKNQLRLKLWLLRHIWRADGIFFRFADYYAVLPAIFARIFRKRLWIVVGGYDANWWPEYGYGVYDRPFRAALVRFVLRSATAVIPVHSSLADWTNGYWFDEPRRNGLRANVPGIDPGKIVPLPDGYDGAYWSPDPVTPKEPIVMLTASVPQGMPIGIRRRMALLKGVPLLVDVARRLPQYRFLIAGPTADALPPETGDLPPNVEIAGFLSLDRLRDAYRRARVYAHPSMTEGLPGSVAEAMLCGCVPVGSSVAGIPDLVGDTGVVVDRHDADRWIAAIERAMAMDTGSAARDRILARFNREDRCARLREIVGDG